MKGIFAVAGFRSVGIEYDVRDRLHARSSWSLWQLWNFALDGITSFSTVPLRAWMYVGSLVAAASILYALVIVTQTLLFGRDVPGFATVVVLILFLGGIQLLSLGILGEYVGRVFQEVKQRPLYLVESAIPAINEAEQAWKKAGPGRDAVCEVCGHRGTGDGRQ